MDKNEAGMTTEKYLKMIYGFALSKTGSHSQAEELAEDIAAEVYVTLLRRDNIANIGGYIYKIARNVWVRRIKKPDLCIYGYEGMELIPDNGSFSDEICQNEIYGIIRREITYLSSVCREILIRYYYKQQNTAKIAADMNLPSGTVKWHLSCGRKELKTNMERTRTVGNLGIKPIRFSDMGHSGRPGTKGDTADFFAKVITQNIAYAAYFNPKTVNEIAEELGINPIFVEDEVNTLEEYGFMDKLSGGKYRTNMRIFVANEECSRITKEINEKYTPLFAEKFFIPFLEKIQSIPEFLKVPDNDINILKWSMVPFLANKLATAEISDEKFSVKRKDGGDYVAMACVNENEPSGINGGEALYQYCGDMWRRTVQTKADNGSEIEKMKSWRLDVYWGNNTGWRENLTEDYEKLYYFIKGSLEENEANICSYRRLLDRGYLIKDGTDYKVNIIISDSTDKWFELFPDAPEEITELSREYARLSADADIIGQPEHMHPLIRYYSQNAACALHTRIMKYLLDKNVLSLPNEDQRKGLCTVMFMS